MAHPLHFVISVFYCTFVIVDNIFWEHAHHEVEWTNKRYIVYCKIIDICSNILFLSFTKGGRVWYTGCSHAPIPEAPDAECSGGLSRRRDQSNVWEDCPSHQTTAFTRRTQVIYAAFLTQEKS